MNEPKPIMYIYNLLEDVLSFHKSLDKEERSSVTSYITSLFGEFYFLGVISEFKNIRKQFYLYTANSIEESYLQYMCDLLQVPRKSIHIMFPKQIDFNTHVGNFCQTIIDDKETMEKLQNIDIISYCNSDELFHLRDVLQGKANFIEAVSRDCWDKMKRYGTKSGFRELVQSLNDENIKIPKGKIFYHSENCYNQAVLYLIQMLKTEGAVVKIDKGYSGNGVVIIKKNEVDGLNEIEVREFILSKMKQVYWKNFNIVVEDLIDIDYENPNGGSPYCALTIDDKGHVQVKCIPKMVIGEGKSFLGVQFGKDALSSQITQKIIYASQTLGNIFAKAGYRGYFDFDFLIDKNGKIFVCQSNIRRDGGTPTYTFAQGMYGRDFDKTHYFVDCFLEYQNLKDIPFSRLLEEAKKRSLDFSKQKGGIVFTSVQNIRANHLYFFSVGKSRAEAFQHIKRLQEMCKELLSLNKSS